MLGWRLSGGAPDGESEGKGSGEGLQEEDGNTERTSSVRKLIQSP